MSKPVRRIFGAVAATAAVGATAIVFAAVAPSVSAVAAGTPAPSAGCHLANGIKP